MYNNIMNYVISSIILLSIVFIIIYILSIDNNIHKVKNKLQEFFTVFKSKEINYLNDKDNINLLNYIKYQFKNNDNVTIPSKIFYIKTDKGFELNDINIICYKYDNNNFKELPYTINILFVPFEKDNYFSNQTLFGLHGNYVMTIINGEKQSNKILPPVQEKKVTFAEEDSIINTEVLDMIPDVIHLSETESEENTTDTEKMIKNLWL
jgi:hypothetical protein